VSRLLGVKPLPVVAAAKVQSATERVRWLVEGLWGAEAVGVIGGAPKSCKTWLALDLALSVASGSAALGRFAVSAPGTVLLYAAEDSAAEVRDRLAAIAAARALSLAGLKLGVILAPTLRLDRPTDRLRLERTLERYRPRLLLLDPLVRLHAIDENSAADVSALLGELRALQREYAVAIVLVHHLRKNAPRTPDGQALRGSGDLHAWGDSNLYLRRRDRSLLLTVEHRSAPAAGPFTLELASQPALHLRVLDSPGADDLQAHDDLAARVLATLAAAATPLSRDALRDALKTRNATLGEALTRLRTEGKVVRVDGGFALCQQLHTAIPVPVPIQERERNGAQPTTGPNFDGFP
jgi:hypothetical protein